jgi:hypothetical protein
VENKTNDIIINKFCDKLVNAKLPKSETSTNSLETLKRDLEENRTLLYNMKAKNDKTKIEMIIGGIVFVLMGFICYKRD